VLKQEEMETLKRTLKYTKLREFELEIE